MILFSKGFNKASLWMDYLIDFIFCLADSKSN